MPNIYWDVETFSTVSLKERGAHCYAAHPSTDIHFFCYAVDNEDAQTWRPGDPVPEPFANPDDYRFVSHNWTFENAILRRVLIPKYGFVALPWERQDCVMRLALASAYPAELGLACAALGLPYKKDPEARKAMLRLAKPPAKKPKDPDQRARDLVLLEERCKTDVLSTRAVHRSQLLRPLLPQERAQLLLDAEINETGIGANMPFLEAMRIQATIERNAVNVRLGELTEGAVTSVDQVQRIKKLINERGHEVTTLGKQAVVAALAQHPEEFVRELLTLRQCGAYASVRMAKRLLGYADPIDGRIRGALRFCGAGPGRWTSPGAQLQNLRRNDANYPGHLIDACLTNNRAELARYSSNPIDVVGQLSRAALCARPGHILICVDFASIESRVSAWFAGEAWKLSNYQKFDAASDKDERRRLENYRVVASHMLRIPIGQVGKFQRQRGKGGDLACGYGGSVGAWRRIMGAKDARSDAEIKADIDRWRAAHPMTQALWYNLANAARAVIRNGNSTTVGGVTRPAITAAFDGYALTLTLPSGRAINYPGARLMPNRKFEDGAPDIEYLDNAKGQWKPVRAWHGTLTENVVQAASRDLLAAALLRFAARDWLIVFHCHDEIMIEVPEGSVTEAEVLALLLEPPAWATGLPLGGKAHSGPTYFEEPDEDDAAKPLAPEATEPEAASADEAIACAMDAFVISAESLEPTKETEREADSIFLDSLDDTLAPLTDLVSLPMDSSNRVACPFHDDPNPSCSIYPDHFYCHGCGERGDRVDWLMRVDGMTRAEALAALQDRTGPAMTPMETPEKAAEKLAYALSFWDAAGPLAGTMGERYLAETRGINTGKLPLTIHEALRFHPRCVFSAGAQHPCIIALMRDPVTDAPTGIHRIGLAQTNGTVAKLDRMALGRMGVVKLWSVNGAGRLVIGEGVETVLAAATRIPWQGAPLTPAWSTISAYGIRQFPVIDSVPHLIVLADHDIGKDGKDGEGQRAARTCKETWTATGRQVTPLMPRQPGWDFNDVVLGRKA
jgi:DNA polymerase